VKKCSKNKQGDACRRKKNQCTCKLNRWLANNRSLVSGDRSEAMCNPLPTGVTEVPDENHPLNSILRCNKRVCGYIVGSELPWCEVDRSGTFADSNYVVGNQQFASWTSGSGSCNMCKCNNGIASVAEKCPQNGDVHCSSCSGYFEMNDAMACVPMAKCYCPNGTPTSREECPTDGATRCSACDEGYTMSGDMECTATCTCANGSVVPDSECQIDGAELCVSCFSGFEFENGEFDANGNGNCVSTGALELGCYKDCSPGRDLPVSRPIPSNRPEGSIQYCRELCGSLDGGYAFAGIQFTTQCFCGNSFGSQGTANNCNMACADGTGDICGGSCANNVYDSL